MREPYAEGLATHGGPESCGRACEGAAEALTGERAGRVLSREIFLEFWGPKPWSWQKAIPAAALTRRAAAALARSKTPSMYGNTLRENREIP
jgi:hypothetical protein